MDKLLFLHNELMNPERQREMKLPLKFISYGIVEGRMYKHFRNQSNFILPLNASKRWGNDVVYGGIFLCKDFDFYARIFDAYHVCSLTTMLRNHLNDVHHRVTTLATPIHFDTLEELAHIKYKEILPIEVQMYIGNLNHPKITQRLTKTNSYRIADGIDVDNFKKLFWEESK